MDLASKAGIGARLLLRDLPFLNTNWTRLQAEAWFPSLGQMFDETKKLQLKKHNLYCFREACSMDTVGSLERTGKEASHHSRRPGCSQVPFWLSCPDMSWAPGCSLDICVWNPSILDA